MMAALVRALYEGAFNLFEKPMQMLQYSLGAHRMAWVFLLPNLLIFGLFTYLPIMLNVWYASTSGDRILLGDRDWVGSANFATLLDCGSYLDPNTCRRDLFWRAVHNTGWFVVLQVGFMILLSLIAALILNRNIPLKGFFRAVFFYPVLLSPVVVALIWKWILQRNGVLNAGMDWAGMDTVNWLLDPSWAFFWIVFVSIWANMGFYVLILLAGLQAIPGDVYEAAEMDGTPAWRQLFRITLPLLTPTLLVVMVLSLIRAVQAFDEIYVLTGGGPGSATTLLIQYIYDVGRAVQAFDEIYVLTGGGPGSATTLLIQYIYDVGFATRPRQFGLAAAASLLMAGVLLVLTLLQLAATRKRAEEG